VLSAGFIICLMIFFLPYTNSLVLDIGFPFKIYELLGSCLFLLLFLRFLTKGKCVINIHKKEKQIYLFLFVFFIWYCVTGIIGIYTLEYTASATTSAWAVGRYAPGISAATKLFYFLFNIILFFLVATYINNKETFLKVLRIWIISSFIVSLYTVYLFIGSIFKTHLFLLPGTQDIQYIVVAGLGTFIRNSTFKEGNIFGGYMVSSLLITLPLLFIKEREVNPFPSKVVYVIFFFQLCALLISYSTVNILVFIITYFIFFKITHLKKIRVPKKPFYAVLFLGITVIAFLFSPSGKSLFYQKLFGTDKFWSYSRIDRTNMALTAMRMTYDYPILGVGPTNYGFYYNDYTDPALTDTSIKRIAGNIYAEILCESGLPGLICYILFLFSIIRLFIAEKKHIPENYAPVANSFFCGFAGMLITFLAFPTFTLTFHWVLMGLLISSTKVLQNKECPVNKIQRKPATLSAEKRDCFCS
jgi:hypothetical protein